MTQSQLATLQEILNLGTSLSEPLRVYGGLLHYMWRVDTADGSYAIKQLNSTISLDDHTIKNYELTELIAQKFYEIGVPAIVALKKDGQSVFIIEGSAFIVYPWVNAHAVEKNKVTIAQAQIIAALLARMHAANIHVGGHLIAEFPLHSNDEILSLINDSNKTHMPFAPQLMAMKELIITFNNKYHASADLLRKNVVVSHGDLDQKNVLWDEYDNPYLIDWESARLLNPTQEIINAAFDWAGIITPDFDQEIFDAMLMAYNQIRGVLDKNLIEASYYAIGGNWINWMVYNLKRSMNGSNKEEKEHGIACVDEVLQTFIYLDNKKEHLYFYPN